MPAELGAGYDDALGRARSPRCKVCEHAISAHFTSPAHLSGSHLSSLHRRRRIWLGPGRASWELAGYSTSNPSAKFLTDAAGPQ
jgi:hypothetical protein